MKWSRWRPVPWIDTRAAFVAGTHKNGVLLDLGSSDGSTLSHMAELRPDLTFLSVDIAGPPSSMPAGTRFARADLEKDRLPWPDGSVDAVTCMHVIEHLRTATNLWTEISRLLKPGGRVYVETPGEESVNEQSAPDDIRPRVTVNFFDDPTHIAPVSVDKMRESATSCGLAVLATGRSRNLLFAAAYPFFRLLPTSRKRYVAMLHWVGWSAYLIAEKPAA